jgi:hypothetical protein
MKQEEYYEEDDEVHLDGERCMLDKGVPPCAYTTTKKNVTSSVIVGLKSYGKF